MTDLSSSVALVRDNGFFLPIARRLAKDYGQVFYCPTWQKAYPVLNEGVIGDGFGDITLCLDMWDPKIKSRVDTWVFPDVGYLGEQKELRSQGLSVWGAGDGMRLEQDREYFLRVLKDLNLDVAPHTVVVGLTALRDFLKERQDIFIKLSRWRGSWETFHWRSLKQDGHRLDLWAVKFGGVKELIRFICFENIETTLEIGADSYGVDGDWPATMLHGIECKDAAYFSAVTKKKDMPKQLTDIMDAFSPLLGKNAFRSQWSMEVRVSESGNFFIDATTRGGLPSTASFLKAKNVSQVIYHGAMGDLVEIDYGFKYSAECMVKIHGEEGAWDTIVLEDELKEHLLMADCCEVDGQTWFPADEKKIEEIGWLRATGDTPIEVAKEMNRLADLLPDGADANVEALAAVIKEVDEAAKAGIPFTNEPMPTPSIVLQ